MKYKVSLLVGAIVASFAVSNLYAVTINIGGSNVSNGVGDQVVVDNTGNVILGASGIATIGYFSSISDPTSASLTTLASDFISLASTDFGESLPANGLFVIDGSIESDSAAFADALGNDLYLFLGDATSLSASTSVGLINIGEQLEVPSGLIPPSVSIDYSGGLFANGGEVVLGEITDTDVIFAAANGTTILNDLVSTGSFQLVAVPEPSSAALVGLGGLALILRRRR